MSFIDKIIRHICYDPLSFALQILCIVPLFVIIGCLAWGTTIAVVAAVCNLAMHIIGKM